MDNIKHIAWPSINGFSTLRKFFTLPDLTQEFNTLLSEPIQYKAKVKLHGTNAGIQIHEDGAVIAQSRENLLVDGADNSGFAKWVETKKEELQTLRGYCVFGEWCGKGIQDVVAVSEIPTKFFAVFGILELSTGKFFAEPSKLKRLCEKAPSFHILPWASWSTKRADISIEINWQNTAEALEETTTKINKEVEAIEACDPWVETTFGVKGTGEGLVFYPMVALEREDYKMFENLCFKAKGEKHRVVKSSGAATVNPETAANAQEFVKLVLTEARLSQGATATSPEFDKKKTGVFVNWVLADVQKETQAELSASNLEWKDVQKPLTEYARKWYLNKS